MNLQEWSEQKASDIRARILTVRARPGQNKRELARLDTALEIAVEREASGEVHTPQTWAEKKEARRIAGLADQVAQNA